MDRVAQCLAETRFRGGINYSLDRLAAPLAVLGDPHLKLPPVIHVAGTNGKGSTVAYMALALQGQGYGVATYTSPHLYTYRERFQVNGQHISERDFCRLYDDVAQKTASFRLTEFELLTLMFFVYVLEQGPDFVVLETGIGGRLDATNVVIPALSIITRVGLDHHEYLGSTLTEIASEKAGIIKMGVPVVTCGGQAPSVLSVIDRVADRLGVECVRSSDVSPCPDAMPLFQAENLGLVRAAMALLPGVSSIGDRDLLKLGESMIPGRFQVVQRNGQCIVTDVAHNVLGLERVVAEYRRQFPGISPEIILALSKGRDPKLMVPVIEQLSDSLYYLESDSPYLVPCTEVLATYPNVKSVSCLSELSGAHILVVGSFYMMGFLQVE